MLKTGQSSGTKFSAFIVDKFIAPGASALQKADIPDMSTHHKESSYWLANLFLSSVFRSNFDPPLNAYIFNYLRRAQAAFTAHSLARSATIAFVESGSQSPNRYADAILQWEIFLGQAWHGFALLRKAFNLPKIFEPGDGSVFERLNHFYNAMKHVESRIENGQMLPEATVPVWLSDDGLVSTDAKFSYSETAEVLREVAKWAEIFGDPATAKEKLLAMDVTGAADGT